MTKTLQYLKEAIDGRRKNRNHSIFTQRRGLSFLPEDQSIESSKVAEAIAIAGLARFGVETVVHLGHNATTGLKL